MEKKNTWETYSNKQLKELERFSKEYMEFLNQGKTERECIDVIVNQIEADGYEELESIMKSGRTLQTGDKVYAVCMNKSIVMFKLGETPMTEGMNILGAHIDSPRLDVKQRPLYEEEEFAYLDTHYYGGIKKYQWVAMPLALHGVVVRKDGTKEMIVVGEKQDDPVFVITDLLPHLDREKRDKPMDKFIDAEKMDLLIGNLAAEDQEKEAVKNGILHILKRQYNIEEDDFLSAEFEIVPAGASRECGLDRSMIIGYGQDDRVCAFTSLFAMLEEKEVERTSCCLLVDKEEIGSVGASGMTSKFFENAVAEVMALTGAYSELALRRALANSKMLSSDVSAAFDPMFPEVYEKKNSAYFANGPVFNKYTGAGGKSRTNDANAEYIAELRKIMEDNDVKFQTAELGRIDAGGGGTIAYILAVYGMEVIDSGIAVLNMHAPWEVTSKADIYEAVKCYRAFLKAGFSDKV